MFMHPVVLPYVVSLLISFAHQIRKSCKKYQNEDIAQRRQCGCSYLSIQSKKLRYGCLICPITLSVRTIKEIIKDLRGEVTALKSQINENGTIFFRLSVVSAISC